MKVITLGTYSQTGLAALAEATYEQRRTVMDEIFSSAGGKIIEYFFCDGDVDFVIVAEIPNREVSRGMRNNALATGSVSSLKNYYEINLAEVTASQRNSRNTFKPITE